MTSKLTVASARAILAPRLPASRSSVSSSVVVAVGLLRGLVLLPLISAGCGPPT